MTITLRTVAYWVATALLWGSPLLSAEEEINTKPLRASAPSQISLIAGDESEFTIQMSLAQGYHAYVERFALKALNTSDFTIVRLEPSPIVKFIDVNTKEEKEGIKDDAQLKVFVKTLPSAKSGS